VFEVCGREIAVYGTPGLTISDRASTESRDPKGCDRPSFLDANFTTAESYFEAVAAWFNEISRSRPASRSVMSSAQSLEFG
jgi:hypothetical protein